MNTTKIQALKEGCGKEFIAEGEDYICGEDFEYNGSEGEEVRVCFLLCSECQAKLSQAQEDKIEFDNFVVRLKEELDKIATSGRSWNQLINKLMVFRCDTIDKLSEEYGK